MNGGILSKIRETSKSLKDDSDICQNQGRSQGKGEIPPPNRKNCRRKTVLFPRLFLVTNFPKNKNKK